MQGQTTADAFQQELDNLDMTTGLFDIRAPGVHAMAPNEETVTQWIGRTQALAELIGQPGYPACSQKSHIPRSLHGS